MYQHRNPYNRPKEMLPEQQYILVLWGDYFDEYMAISFITAFREAGMPVKIVGFHQQQAKGMVGTAIYTEISLDEATALLDRTQCVILPCATHCIKRLENDPRFVNFMAKATVHQAKIIVGCANQDELCAMNLPLGDWAHVLVYGCREGRLLDINPKENRAT